MTDIDWDSQPEATHYNDMDGVFCKITEGNWHELQDCGDWDEFAFHDDMDYDRLIPRPAQYRNWSDHAMWFDAPEWAASVWYNKTKDYYAYAEEVLDKNRIAIVDVDDGKERVGYLEDGSIDSDPNWQQIATRPTKEKPKLEELVKGCEPGMFSEDPHPPTADSVNHPSHYTQGGIECIDALKAATVGKTGIEAVCVANAIKYLWRYEEKNGAEDVKKAKWYIKRLIKELK